MTALEFLRVLCWLFFVMETLTALIVAALALDPSNVALAAAVVLRCSIAALVSLGLIGVIGWLQRNA